LAAPDRLAAQLPEATAGPEARAPDERPGARAVRGGARGDHGARGGRSPLPRTLRGRARRSLRQPARRGSAGLKRIRVAAAAAWDGERLLMTQRAPGGALGLAWEVPGGKIEAGETPAQGRRR